MSILVMPVLRKMKLPCCKLSLILYRLLTEIESFLNGRSYTVIGEDFYNVFGSDQSSLVLAIKEKNSLIL